MRRAPSPAAGAVGHRQKRARGAAPLDHELVSYDGAATALARGAARAAAAVGRAAPPRPRRDRACAQRARGVRLPPRAGRARRAAQRVGAPALQRARRHRRLHARRRGRAAGRRRRVPGTRRHAAPLHRHAGLHQPQRAAVERPRGLCVAKRRPKLAGLQHHAGRPVRGQRPAAPGPRADVSAHAPSPSVLPARRAPRRRAGERAALCAVHRRGRHAPRPRAQRPHAAAHGPHQGLAEPARLHAPPSHRRGGHAVGRAQPGAARGKQRPRPPADHPRRQPRRASVLPAAAHAGAARAAGRQLVLPAARAPFRLPGRPRALRRRQRRRQQSRALAAANGAAYAALVLQPAGQSRHSAFGFDRRRAQD
ncbi:translation initiation factor IF-2 [Gracilaria domingensis]|nr:translation initiation factor IF-2 [Gracilaria domingensis]